MGVVTGFEAKFSPHWEKPRKLFNYIGTKLDLTHSGFPVEKCITHLVSIPE
jgi:hypothetical protein